MLLLVDDATRKRLPLCTSTQYKLYCNFFISLVDVVEGEGGGKFKEVEGEEEGDGDGEGGREEEGDGEGEG